MPLADARRVDAACLAFEDAWLAGSRPDVAQYVAGAEGPARSVLLGELLRLDVHYRRLQGESPTAEEYLPRWPDDVPVVADVFREEGASIAPADLGDAPQPIAWQLREYVVLDKIGQGGMGVVYKARHLAMKRVVAVKVLSASSMSSPEAVQRFYQEVEVAAWLSHPNIVAAYDAGEHEGRHYLVMEYVDGQDLARIVKDRGPLPVGEAVDYVLQAAEGLAYAHGEGIVHRDIKPGNLLLDRQGRIKIVDMGLARIQPMGAAASSESDRLTETGQVMGTFDYMAPEQAEDSRQADRRADIYSLGCTFHYLLTGNPPYSCETRTQTLLAHRNSPIPSLRAARLDVSEALEAVYRKMMAKRPEDRYPTMGEVAEDFKACLSGPFPAALPATPRREEDGAELFPNDLTVAPPATRTEPPAASEDGLGHRSQRDTTRSLAARLAWAARENPRALTAMGGGVVALAVLLVLLVTWYGRNNLDEGSPRNSPAGSQGPSPLAAPLVAAQARQYQEAWASHLGVPAETSNSIGMKLVLIPPGEFEMGSTQEEIERLLTEAKELKYETAHIEELSREGPRHRVRITRPFWLGKHEVTVGQFRKFVEESNYDAGTFDAGTSWRNAFPGQTDEHPVTGICWTDAARFCEWLSRKEGMNYCLPSEAEWEYACRAGSQTRWSFGDNESDLEKFAWFNRNADGQTHPVGQKLPNAWGLHDVHGNVLEFCADAYDGKYYANAPQDDPKGPSSEGPRVLRGGSWYASPGDSRSAFRLQFAPDYRDNYCGFRVAMTP